MIVCLCHRVSDRDIERAVHLHGVRNFEVLQDMTRVSSCCGCCRDCAREVFDSACTRGRPVAPNPPPRTLAAALGGNGQTGEL
jgi:bacterioferritin-associated ferredoxin